MAGAAALAAVLVVVLNGGSAKPPTAPQALALQPVNDAGPAPFTPSTANPSATPSGAAAPTVPSTSAADTGTGGTVQGSAPGLYGGTQRLSSCDVAQLSAYLTAHPDKGKAWAGVEGIPQSSVPSYLASLTPVVLRADTRVTNHGFSNGAATSFQSVLQSGTAVLVDTRGLPRARCSCGNPLLPPVLSDAPKTLTGTSWQSFRLNNLLVVQPSVTQVNYIVLYDVRHASWFARQSGTQGEADHPVPPPTTAPSNSTTSTQTPTTSPTTSSPTGTPTGSPSNTPPTTPATPTDTATVPTPTDTQPSPESPATAPTGSAAPLTGNPATAGGSTTSAAGEDALLTLRPNQGTPL
jgi:hypothetical protein